MSAGVGRGLGAPLLLAILSGGGAVFGITRAGQEFLDRHWHRPLPPQGAPPARFSPLERSLEPSSCGVCHPAQWNDWQTTVHARSMGPGVRGQLAETAHTDPASVGPCLDCHAPLAEQRRESEAPAGRVANADFDPSLERQGLVCAACHVRHWERFGPPRPDGTLASEAPRASLPHDGATRTAAFLRSEFCKSCHQFAADGYALNGKPLENTYEEWRASPAARRRLQCQSCHMPDRRHLWRGIHDPEMVRSGIEVSLVMGRPRYRPGEQVTATLVVINTGVGHYFPTYVTPRVVVRTSLIDTAGRPVAGSLEEATIGREVTLDLSRELADTRIAPGGRFTFRYRRRLDRPGLRLAVSVTVYPDHFYTGFFESLLASERAGAGAGQIREALEKTRRSSYPIFSRELPLT